MVPVLPSAIVPIRNKKIMRRFKDAGAIGPQNAIPAAQAGLRNSFAISRFVALGWLAREGDRLYIPESFTHTRRWRLMFGKRWNDPKK